MKGDPSMEPDARPHGFLSSVRKVTLSSPSAFVDPILPEGVVQRSGSDALVHVGSAPEELAAALTHREDGVTVSYPVAFSPGN